jgi:hypothetical protein
MPANIKYSGITLGSNPFNSDTLFMLNKAAANNFFKGMTILDATASLAGVVKLASVVTYSPATLTTTYSTFNIDNGDGTITTVQVVDKTSYDAMKAELDLLKTAVGNLVTNLKTAGTLASS